MITKFRERALLFEYSKFLLLTISTLITTPLLLNSLGPQVFGILAAITSTTAFLSISDFGVSSALPRLIALNAGLGNDIEVRRIASTSTIFYFLLSLAISLSAITLGKLFISFLDLDQPVIAQGEAVAMAAIYTIAFSLLVTPLSGVLYGFHRLDLVSLASIVGIIATTVFTIILALNDRGILAIQLARSSGVVVTGFLIVFFVVKVLPNGLIRIQAISGSALKRILSMSVPLFIVGIGHVTLFYMDNVIIVRILGPSMVTGYAISFQLISPGLQLLFLMGGIFVPLFSAEFGKGNVSDATAAFNLLSKFTFSLAILIFSGILLLGIDFIEVWTQKQGIISKEVLATLSVLILVRGITHPGATLLSSIGKHAFVAKCQIAEAILNIVISIVLARPLGLLGVALGSVIAQSISTLLFVPRDAIMSLSIRGRDYVGMLAPVVVIGASSFALGSMVYSVLPAGVIRLLFSGLVLVIGFLTLSWKFSLNESEKRFISSRLTALKVSPRIIN